MDKGIIVQTGTPVTLIFKPDNDFSKSFFNHQRLQLELSALKFKDIWHVLADAAPSSQASLDSSQSLWEGMELLSEKNQDTLVVLDGDDSSLKEITLQTIQSHYLQIKRSR
jgi:osmoprotectant transport system ATP-binding protein